MLVKYRKLIQSAFLIAFAALIVIGRVQIWLAVFLFSTLAAFLYGRFYCGFICPINSLIEWLNIITKSFKRKSVPYWLKKPIFRYFILLIFISIMIFTLKTGRKIPVLPVLTLTGALLTLFFVPQLWHKYLCPYGILLNIASKRSKHFFAVDSSGCIKCGLCKNVCPGEAVIMKSKKDFPEIDKGLCLECTACINTCPKASIRYNI